MRFWAENGRKRFAALTSVRARADFEPVALQVLTCGAADLRHLSRLDPRKPDGFLAVKPGNLNSKSVSRQNASFYEDTS